MIDNDNLEKENENLSDPWQAEPDPTKTDDKDPFDRPFVPVKYSPEDTTENVRRSGLAWSAGVAFFGSVAFMLFLGWLADLLLGSSPWGIVVGIVFGSLIGFVQFFRISSQIYGTKPPPPESRPLLSRDEDDVSGRS